MIKTNTITSNNKPAPNGLFVLKSDNFSTVVFEKSDMKPRRVRVFLDEIESVSTDDCAKNFIALKMISGITYYLKMSLANFVITYDDHFQKVRSHSAINLLHVMGLPLKGYMNVYLGKTHKIFTVSRDYQQPLKVRLEHLYNL